MGTDYAQILLDVQKKSNIAITNIRDVKCLKEEIESFKDLKIGFNTLRRLFGFLQKTKPTLATLNTLAGYLEFRSYASYLSNKLNFDTWYFQQKLLLIQQKKNLNKEDLTTLKQGLEQHQNIVYVAYFVANLIQINKLGVLHDFFKRIDLKDRMDSDLLKFATIVTHTFYGVDPSKVYAIYKDLMPYESFRIAVPFLYIDYSHLNGIYLEVLALVEENSKRTSDLLFVALMRFYQQFYSLESFWGHEIEFPEKFNKLSPVLKGRYFAYKIMASNFVDNALKNAVFKECKKIKVHLFVEEVLPALMIKEEYEILSVLSEKYYEEIFESANWSSKTTNSMYLVALATINWHKKAFKTAKINLELVALAEVELSYYDYISLFYYLTKMKISHAERATTVNAMAFFMVTKLVSKTGFVKFLTASEKYILK
jgi:hypothetical protein